MLTFFQSGIAGGRRLGKGGRKIQCGDVLPRLMFQLLKNWKRNLAYRGSRELRRNTDLHKVCIMFLYFVFITRLTYLVSFGSGGRGFDVLTLWQICWLEVLIKLIKGILDNGIKRQH